MTAPKPSLGYKRVNLCIKEEALKALEANGVTERKRGEKISELILREYASKSAELPQVPIGN